MSLRSLLDEKTVTLVMVCLLSSMVLLAASSSPPVVEISSVPGIENGTVVKIRGVLVDINLYDSGAEGLIIADLGDGTVVKVISSPGVKCQPSSYAKIGDEILVEGEVAASGSSNVIFTTSDDLTTLRASELVLTVAAVSRNWFLFEGDVVRVKGLLEQTESSTGLRLNDLSSRCSIAVLPGGVNLGPLIGTIATLTAEVRFDYRLSSLTLVPLYAGANR